MSTIVDVGVEEACYPTFDLKDLEGPGELFEISHHGYCPSATCPCTVLLNANVIEIRQAVSSSVGNAPSVELYPFT